MGYKKTLSVEERENLFCEFDRICNLLLSEADESNKDEENALGDIAITEEEYSDFFKACAILQKFCMEYDKNKRLTDEVKTVYSLTFHMQHSKSTFDKKYFLKKIQSRNVYEYDNKFFDKPSFEYFIAKEIDRCIIPAIMNFYDKICKSAFLFTKQTDKQY